MNIKLTLKTIGQVLLVESALMLIPLAVALLCGGGDAMAILISLVITAAAGELLSLLRPRSDNLRAREGFAVVALGWILVSFFGCLPFRLHGCIPKLVDAYFETVSGFTTTGATLLTDVEVLPKGLLFWRSFSHWVGGMGVLVLSLALLPKMGARSIHLMRAESPGPAVDKLVPRVGNNTENPVLPLHQPHRGHARLSASDGHEPLRRADPHLRRGGHRRLFQLQRQRRRV